MSRYASTSARDHPRVGGEKTAMLKLHTLVPGSPPRGRGKVQKLSIFQIAIRITPAWAGKSSEAIDFSDCNKDHPRVGGEKFLQWVQGIAQAGSPPRGRGKAERVSGSFSGLRITPAWAGKSPPSCTRTPGRRDHPRVGGEKVGKASAIDIKQGSPPRGRGKVRF